MSVIPYNVLCEQIKQLTIQLDAAKNYLKVFYPDMAMPENSQQTDARHAESNTSKELNTERGLKVKEKVLYALNEIGTGKTKDVVGKLIALFPEYASNREKAKKDARLYLSAYAIAGKIKVVRRDLQYAGYIYGALTNADSVVDPQVDSGN